MWLRQSGDDNIRAELKQKGYDLDDVPRTGRSGGGLALLHRDNIKIHRIDSGELPSYEYSQWKVHCSTHVLVVIGIYRPPYSPNHRITQSQFLNEFPSLLDEATAYSDSVLILGDLNIHFDNENDIYANQLTSLLHSYDIKQEVCVPTHISGHILDVIISRGSDRIEVSNPIADYFISDHCFTSCSVSTPKPPQCIKTVKFRKWKSLNQDEFIADLA
jgi:hypothetical protein